MTKVEKRLAVSILAVNMLVCMVAALACMEGWVGTAVLIASAAANTILALLIYILINPDPFISVFASSGITALALSGTPSGLLFMFIPLLGYMTGLIIPAAGRRYSRYSTIIAAAYFAVLWSVRLAVPLPIGGHIIAELTGTLGALMATVLMVHVETHRRDLLKFEARRSEESASKDALTGLNNRKSLEAYIVEQARKIDSFSVIMMDIDNFKKVNDTYGHVEGDAVLKDLSLVIQCHVRTRDRAFRYGGEEFAIVCPGTDMKGAGMLAERIRESFSSKKYIYEGFTDPELRERRFTVSLGVAESRVGEFKDAKSLIARCDEALYEAKHTGKNRVCYSRQADTLKLGDRETEGTDEGHS